MWRWAGCWPFYRTLPCPILRCYLTLMLAPPTNLSHNAS
uniref:Uncharacterized protein n=1 Tax=Anguilla anguilla TaxID=7936 RepID=A0A0E9PQJ3_ANGAN